MPEPVATTQFAEPKPSSSKPDGIRPAKYILGESSVGVSPPRDIETRAEKRVAPGVIELNADESDPGVSAPAQTDLGGTLLPSLMAVLLIGSVGMWMFRPGRRLGEGSLAPDFELRDQSGRVHRLADYAGRWLVLYFYPRDDTPACTREACRFRDEIGVFSGLGASVVGVSVDNEASHTAFVRKYDLPFSLLADPRGQIAGRYGSLLNLGLLRFARRHTFIIAPDGRIAARLDRVDPATHAEDVARALRALQNARASRPTGAA